jgi:hypothetical protein
VVVLVVDLVGGLALLIRLALHGRAFDLYGDEVLYTDLGRSVVSGGFPRYNGPFFLHGPGFFYLEAGWVRLLGDQHSVITWVNQMRTLNALVATGTAIALVLLGWRAGSLRAGAAAGLLFALDPFCIRQNDRVLLETALMLCVILGYLVLSPLCGPGARRRDWLRAVGAGLLFGFAILVKDEAVLVTVLPMLAAAALGWGPRRSLSLVTVATAVAVYGTYLSIVAANGYFGVLWPAKFAGVERLLGLSQISGFHNAAGGSLQVRLLAEVAFFGTTYAMLALAVPALALIIWRGGQLPRLLALFYCSAGAALGYALVGGTLEEQELYLLIVPSLMIIPVAATLLPHAPLGRARPAAPRQREISWTAMIASLVLILSINLFTCVQWLRQPDDGFARLTQYVTARVPAGTALGTIEGDIETPYALGDRYYVGQWETPAALSANRVRYVVVEWAPVDQGYSDLSSSQVRQLVSHGRVVFSSHGRTYGDLDLYRVS